MYFPPLLHGWQMNSFCFCSALSRWNRQNCKMSFAKLQNVFVWNVKCIFPFRCPDKWTGSTAGCIAPPPLCHTQKQQNTTSVFAPPHHQFWRCLFSVLLILVAECFFRQPFHPFNPTLIHLLCTSSSQLEKLIKKQVVNRRQMKRWLLVVSMLGSGRNSLAVSTAPANSQASRLKCFERKWCRFVAEH